jgi:hypothetical protein
VIGCNCDMCGPAFDHSQNRSEDTPDRRHLPSVRVLCGWQGVIVPEQLVSAVDQIDFQGAAPTQTYRTAVVSINCDQNERSASRLALRRSNQVYGTL